ncbi:F0F1 ATP synthase subunit B [Microseira sp. BLCC-F43]|jgi:F-type H+-transporting ATPase subunit b|uniref:F0F1 ATP synthase subunit B n=1 Tax=Microseira sp. BLCC-F43 TaxID=3153602 RepID=UPI0035B8A567
MLTFILLGTAEAAAEAAEGGFGINFDILETNLINLSIVIGVLVYFGRGFLGNVLSDRRSKIEEAITDAEQRLKTAQESLADWQQKLAQAQAEAEKIRRKAEEDAKAAREAILAQATKDIERLRESAGQDMETARERAIAELRQRVTRMALQQVESQLRNELDEGRQQQLVDRSIALLGG